MRFWDTSALLSIIVEEARSPASRDLLRADFEVAAWTFTPLELLSAGCRRQRDGSIDEEELEALHRRVSRVSARWRHIGDAPEIRTFAERALLPHDLRTADALQLTAAIDWSDGHPRGRQFVSGDDKLLAAAAAEGFTTVRPA